MLLSTSMRPNIVWPLLLLALACDKKDAESQKQAEVAPPTHEPKLTKELVPPPAAGLVPGTATEADVAEVFEVVETIKDKALGGDAMAQYGDEPAIRLSLGPKDPVLSGVAWFVGDSGGSPTLRSLELTVDAKSGTCQWIEQNVGGHPEALRSIGSNRSYGPQEDRCFYSAGTSDGKMPVDIDCVFEERDGVAREFVTLSVVPPGGISKRFMTN